MYLIHVNLHPTQYNLNKYYIFNNSEDFIKNKKIFETIIFCTNL